MFKEHLIYYQRCLQNTTQFVLRLRMTDLKMMSECFLVFERSNRTVVGTVVISSICVFYLYLEEDDDRCRERGASWNLFVQL